MGMIQNGPLFGRQDIIECLQGRTGGVQPLKKNAQMACHTGFVIKDAGSLVGLGCHRQTGVALQTSRLAFGIGPFPESRTLLLGQLQPGLQVGQTSTFMGEMFAAHGLVPCSDILRRKFLSLLHMGPRSVLGLSRRTPDQGQSGKSGHENHRVLHG